jgi:hypothetical protein
MPENLLKTGTFYITRRHNQVRKARLSSRFLGENRRNIFHNISLWQVSPGFSLLRKVRETTGSERAKGGVTIMKICWELTGCAWRLRGK